MTPGIARLLRRREGISGSAMWRRWVRIRWQRRRFPRHRNPCQPPSRTELLQREVRGTSTSTYPMKKIPDARPNIVAESSRCLLISIFAMPRLVRSRKLTKYSVARNGTSRTITLPTVRASKRLRFSHVKPSWPEPTTFISGCPSRRRRQLSMAAVDTDASYRRCTR